MTTHEDALRAAFKAAPDEWNCRKSHLEVIENCIAAYLSALLPEDVAGLVERLMGENPDSLTAADRLRMFAHDPETFEFDQHDALSLIPTIEDAASLIQSQAARIAELEAGVSEFADPANWVVNGRFDPHSGNFDATTFAVALLNKEAKG